MAKVKIQGNASGTGILTVTAPNTSTDRTITLPDGTGTLIADDGSGNVGIGITPVEKLHLAADSKIQISGSGDSGHLISQNGSGTTQISLQGGAASQNFKFSVISNTSSYFTFNTNTGEQVRITDNGLTFNGDTSAANALDDYEEGTFTPTIDSSSYKGGTWSTIAGWYTKIGNTVTVWVGITGSGIYINNAQGYVPISGAPFSAYMPTTLNTYSGTWSADTVTKALSGAVYLNGTNFYLHSSNPSFNTSGANAIAFSVTYQTTA